MAWVTANGFWILILIVFVAMHLFGHGGHGGHHEESDHRADSPKHSSDKDSFDGVQANVATTTAGGHQQ